MAQSQFWGLSVSTDLDAKGHFPIVSDPFKAGLSYSAKIAFSMHALYIFRVGTGIGFNHFSHRFDLAGFQQQSLQKVKSNWNNICVPIKVICCIPISKYAMPMVEFGYVKKIV